MADLILSGPISAPASRWRSALARGGAWLWIGGVLVALLLLIALFAPVIAPHDPAEQDLMSAQLPPAFMRGGEAAFPLGTDSLGRCVLSRLIDVCMAFPPVLLSIVLAAVIGAGLVSVIAAIVVVVWTRFARIIRAETQAQLARDYAAAARVLGLTRAQALRLEILPNLVPLIVTLLAVEMGIAILVEVILSFVGISVTGDTA
ncbi:MAG: ABC transporter permease subunit, partial [Bradyrhizobium sp.]|nr:ABC transporter permease subunit [Bradyrhizobium sp.]